MLSFPTDTTALRSSSTARRLLKAGGARVRADAAEDELLLSVAVLCWRFCGEKNGVRVQLRRGDRAAVIAPDLSGTIDQGLQSVAEQNAGTIGSSDSEGGETKEISEKTCDAPSAVMTAATATLCLFNGDVATTAEVAPFAETDSPLRCCRASLGDCYIEYDSRRMSPEFAGVVLRTWETLLLQCLGGTTTASTASSSTSILPSPPHSSSSLPSSTLICDIPYLSAFDRGTVLDKFNHRVNHDFKSCYKWKPHQKNGDALLHGLFQKAASRFRKRIAVEGPHKTMTYEELEASTNVVAHYLVTSCGVNVGDTVAILFPRCIDSYVALLGVMKAGAAYVPLDVSFPHERIKFTLQRANAKALLSPACLIQNNALDCATLVRECGVEECAHIILDDVLDPSKNPSAATKAARNKAPAVDIPEQSCCYIIFTSGSTGRPKGVQIHHRAAVNLVLAEATVYRVRSDDRVLQGFSLAFDASVEEIWMAFHSGATLVVGTVETMKAGPDLPSKLTTLAITCFSTVPTLLNTVPSGALPTVRLLIVGGEACSRELANRWSSVAKEDASSNREFFNTYGPTEATVVATVQRCVPSHREERVTIGVPLPNYRIYIVTPGSIHLSPPGAVGELMIGGEGVSKLGYIGDPEKTRARFVPDPFAGSGLVYHSGDLARWNPRTGQVEFCGRMDQQVKIRGYRVELSEIESVMLEVDNRVESAVVDVRGDRLVGFVVLRDKKDTAAVTTAATTAAVLLDKIDNVAIITALKQKMGDLLASYMVPSVIHPIEAIPKLTSGKVVRSAIKEPADAMEITAVVAATTASTQQNDSVGIRKSISEDSSTETKTRKDQDADDPEMQQSFTPEQQMIIDVFNRQLGAGQVKSIEDGFFCLGGHSLLVSRAVTQLRTKCPTISARDFYESKGIVKDLAKLVVERNAFGNQIDTKKKVAEIAKLHKVRRKSSTCVQLCCADVLQTLTLWLLALMGLAHTYGVIAIIVFIYAEANFLMMLAWFTGLFYGLLVYSLLLAFLCKWVLIGKYKEGVYPLWGSYHLRWWFVRQMLRISSAAMFTQTCVAPLIYRCMGAKVGRGVFLGSSSYLTTEFDLLSVDEGTTINEDAELKCHQVKDRVLILKKIQIGKDVTISSRSIISGGAVIGDGVFLEPFTLVPEDFHVPNGETWGGSPAVRVVGGKSEDEHTLSNSATTELRRTTNSNVNAGASEVVAEGDDQGDGNNDLENPLPLPQRAEPLEAALADGFITVHSPVSASTVVPEAPVQSQRPNRSVTLFPCWVTCFQLLIALFDTLISIVIYLPALALLVSVLMQATPNSIREYGECQATLYCSQDMLCVPIPSLSPTDGSLQISTSRYCITETLLTQTFVNVTAKLEVAQSSKLCRPVDPSKNCKFPFEHAGGTYNFCTLDPSPNMTIETAAWCKTADGGWSTCAAPCDAGPILVEGPEVYVEDTYNSYTGLTWIDIFATIIAANLSSLFIAWIIIAIMIRVLRNWEHRLIDQEDRENKNAHGHGERVPAVDAAYSIGSWRFIIKWWMGRLLKAAGGMAQPLQGTLMMAPWLRMMGARVGKNVECSSTGHLHWDTLTLGDGTFVADSVMLGVPSVSRGTMRSRPVDVKNRAFVGNGAFVREGSILGEDSLVALQTAAPRTIPSGSTVLGSPPLSVAKREKAMGAKHLTYNPSSGRRCARLAFELFGYLLYHFYAAVFGTVSLFLFDWGYGSFGERRPGLFIAAMPIVQILVGALMCMLVVATKWVVMCGRFKAGVYPLFSFYVWRTELVERLEENLAEPLLLNMLDGTRWKVVYYRCMGARFGKRPYLGHSIVTEPDMISVGNHATIESGGTLQAHLFQDRMRIVKPVALGDSVSLGANSIVLLGGKLHNNVTFSPLSLNMRDEELPPRTEWHGSPATRAW